MIYRDRGCAILGSDLRDCGRYPVRIAGAQALLEVLEDGQSTVVYILASDGGVQRVKAVEDLPAIGQTRARGLRVQRIGS
jgi:hypothetical protein